MKTKKILGTGSLLVLLSGNAFALPTIYPTEGVQNKIFTLTNGTDSNLVGDTVNPNKVYVMPPNSAKAMVSKKLFLKTANLGFCGEMKDLQGYSRNAARDIADYQKRLIAKKKEVDAINANLSNARQLAAEYTSANKLSGLSDIDVRLAALEQMISDKNAELKTCDNNCGVLRDQIAAHMDEQQKLTTARLEVVRANAKAVVKYERLKASVDGYEEDLRAANKSWGQMEDDLASMKSTFVKMYKDLGSLEGARSALSYTSHWNDNIRKLRENNKGIEFEKIQTENAVFTTDLVDLSNVPGASAILGYQLSSCKNSDGKGCQTTTYPESITGSVVLSTIGACPIEHPDYFDLDAKTPEDADDMTYGMTVAYEYPTAMNVTAKATYNMHKMYQKIVSSGRSGGFFRSHSWTSVQERTYFSDSFKVDWSEQDAKVAIPEAKKVEIEQGMRNGIFARLAKIGLPQVASPGDLIAPTVPKTGALVLADELRSNKACQTNYYCTGASILFSVLDSIFGSSSASASYTNVQDADLTDRWSSESVVMKPYITTYVKETKDSNEDQE